jgi:DNA mismatch endonuclease (patch repair protein)
MKPPSEARSRIMRAVRSRDTGPELVVRSLAHRIGYRFRVCRKDLPGCPDIVFPRLKKVIFVHGCFWHGHDCGRGVRVPRQNRSYWRKKITRNSARDEATEAALTQLGWEVSVFWECELGDKARVTSRLRNFLRNRRRKVHAVARPTKARRKINKEFRS